MIRKSMRLVAAASITLLTVAAAFYLNATYSTMAAAYRYQLPLVEGAVLCQGGPVRIEIIGRITPELWLSCQAADADVVAFSDRLDPIYLKGGVVINGNVGLRGKPDKLGSVESGEQK